MPGIIYLKSDEGQELGSFKLSDADLRATVAYVRGLAKSRQEAQKQAPMPPNQPRYPQPQQRAFAQHDQTPVAPGQLRPVEVQTQPLGGPGTAGTVKGQQDLAARFHNQKFRCNPNR